MSKKIKGKYECIVCNKVFDTDGEAVLHNSGDHTTGIHKDIFNKWENQK